MKEEELYWGEEAISKDSFQQDAYSEIKEFLNLNVLKVYYGRQIEVLFEDKYFHWITNRVLRQLVNERVILVESRNLKWGGSVNLYWHKTNRYFKREASKVVNLIERYSLDKIGSAVGRHGEHLALEGFAKLGFVLLGTDLSELRGRKWQDSGHNLDMAIERDGIGYGIEIKNTLSYIPKSEFEAKIEMCHFLGLRPVFVARMLPKSWIHFLSNKGGFALILKHLLYPELLNDLAMEMKNYLGLPVDTPRSLYEGTMKRFEKWHLKNVN